MRLRAVVLLVGYPAFAQTLSVGVKAGVPITQTVNTSGEIGGRPFEASVTRIALGPVMNVRLSHSFSLEFGFLYKRLHQEAGQYIVNLTPGSPFQVSIAPFSQTGRSWEFPLTAQYHVASHLTCHPFVEAGLSFNHLTNALAPFGGFSLNQPVLSPVGGSINRWGGVAGAGLEISLHNFRVTPGLRLTQYPESRPWVPGGSAIELLIGFRR